MKKIIFFVVLVIVAVGYSQRATVLETLMARGMDARIDRKSTRLNSSHP